MSMHTVYQFALSATIFTVLCTGGVLPLRAATAGTYYVATNGKDTNEGTQSQPFSTIRKGVSVLQSGDKLYIRQGTYAEGITPASMSIPSGTSWSDAITISGYPDETVTLLGDSYAPIALFSDYNIAYLVFENFILDASGRSVGFYLGCGSHHIRLSNSEIKHAVLGIQFCRGADDNEVINCSIHDSASHGLYISSSNNLFDGNRVYNNGGYGYHLYNSGAHTVNDNVVRNSEIYGNGSVQSSSFGIALGCGSNNVMYDNVVRDNPAGIQVAYGSPPADNTQVYDNTVYGNSPGSGIEIFPDVTNTLVAHNHVYGNRRGITDSGGIGTVLSDNTVDGNTW